MTSPEDVRSQYGFVAMLAQAIPEIGALMAQAVTEKWTSQRFQLAIANTNWWRTTPPINREWITQQYADPAGATAALQQGGMTVASAAAKLGFLDNVLSPQEAQQAWLHAKLNNFDEAQTRAYLTTIAGPRSVTLPQVGGEYGKWMSDFRSLAQAYDYGNPDTLMQDWSNRSWAGGTGDLAGLQQHLVNYAKGKFAPFADRLQAGETVRDIAQPYIDTMAQTLELNPQDVALSDNLIQRWLQGQSTAGQPPVAAPVWQAKQELRKDPRWQFTRNAWESVADVANTVGRAFGMQG